MAEKSRWMPVGNLERFAAKDRVRSDHEQRRRTEICSAGFEQN
jgi:hypothetical protein